MAPMNPIKRLKKVFLTTSKVQPSGRLALGPAALANLGVDVGDELEVYFDPDAEAVVITAKSHFPNARPNNKENP